MQTHLKQPRKMLLMIDEEILDWLAEICAFELDSDEANPDDFDNYTLEEAIEAKSWFNHKYNLVKRLVSSLDSLLIQLGKEKVRER